MSAAQPSDWNPTSPDVLDDQIAACDTMRHRCPVAHSDYLWWSLFRHADVVRVLEDSETFSNAASNHLSIPNAMDPPEHTLYRKIIERLMLIWAGASVHVCPGAPLTRLELRLRMEALLDRTAAIALALETLPQRATFQASGFATLSVCLT